MFAAFLLALFGLTCVCLIADGLRRPTGIIEFPFLAGCAMLGFLFPQAMGVVRNADTVPEAGLVKSLVMCVLCLAAVYWGWHAPVPAKWLAPRRRRRKELFGAPRRRDRAWRGGAVSRHVPREAVYAAIDSCHLFGFSSVTQGQVLAALEILSRGRPVVATSVGVFPQLLSEPAFGALASANRPEDFAAALRGVGEQVLSGGLRPERIQAAYAERYSRERVLDQYEELLEGLAMRRG